VANGGESGHASNASKVNSDVEADLYPSSSSITSTASADGGRFSHNLVNPLLMLPQQHQQQQQQQQPTSASHSFGCAGGSEGGGGGEGSSGDGGGGSEGDFQGSGNDIGAAAARNRTGTVSVTEYTAV
jgi:hypothetical protein